jgi:hypothetical protein
MLVISNIFIILSDLRNNQIWTHYFIQKRFVLLVFISSQFQELFWLLNNFVLLEYFSRQVNSVFYRLAQLKSIFSVLISQRYFNQNGFIGFKLFAHDSSGTEFRNRQCLDSVNVTSTSTKRLLRTFHKSLCELFLLLLHFKLHRVVNLPYISTPILIGSIIQTGLTTHRYNLGLIWELCLFWTLY